MSPNLLDALLLVVVLLSAWVGVRRGFIIATLQLATLAAGVAIALAGYAALAGWLTETFPSIGVWAAPAALVAIFIVVQVIAGALARRISLAAPMRVHLHAANRTLGVLPGLASGVLNALLVSMVVVSAPLGADVSGMAQASEGMQLLAPPGEWVEAQLTPIFDPAVRASTRALRVTDDEEHAMVQLHFTVTDPNVRQDLEARMLDLVNAERTQRGLKALKADPEMAEVARAHSRDMFARGYFSHNTPEGLDLGRRVKQAHLRYLIAGENLALARTLPAAHDGLMNSPGHRANILRPQFGRVGIGVLDGGLHGLMITQDYRN